MPQIKSRKKDLRQAKARHQRNLGVKRTYKTAVRAARELGQADAPVVITEFSDYQ